MKNVVLKALSLALLIHAAPLSASDSDPTSFLLTRSGLYADGSSALESFEITPDGLVRWHASALGLARGHGCKNEAGSFEGRISEQLALKISRLGVELLKKQSKPKRQSSHHTSREVHFQLRAEADGTLLQSEITSTGQLWDDLVDAIAEAQSTLDANAFVWMSAKLTHANRIQIEFKLVGPNQMQLTLPDTASEAFSVEGSQVRYATAAPKSDRTITLSRTNPKLTVSLVLDKKLSAGQPGTREIRYSNSSFLHHNEADPFTSDGNPPELSLCTLF